MALFMEIRIMPVPAAIHAAPDFYHTAQKAADSL